MSLSNQSVIILSSYIKIPLLHICGGVHSVSSVSGAFGKSNELLKRYPIVIVPAILIVVISILVNYAGLGLVGTIVVAILRFLIYSIMIAAVVLILREGVEDFKRAWEKVVAMITTLILVAIVAAIFSITIILIPVALFMISVVIVDEVNVGETVRRAFNFVLNNLKEVLVIIIILIVIGIIAYAIPTAMARADPRLVGTATIISNVISELVSAYFAIVVTVLYYVKTRGAPAPPTVPLETVAPPPPPT